MPERKKLTDFYLKSLKPAADGERRMVMDKDVPSLGVRISDQGKKTFVLYARYPLKHGKDGQWLANSEKHPSRRELGEYDVLSLEDAREKALEWRRLIKKGIDPGQQEEEDAEKRRQEAERRQADSFRAVAEEYIKHLHARKLRGARELEQLIRRELLGQTSEDGKWVDGKEPVWRQRPIAAITKRDVVQLVRAIKARGGDPVPGKRRSSGGPWAAHHAFAVVRALFRWACAEDILGASPCAGIEAKTLIGPKEPRQRVLTDAEIALVWRASEKLGYPFGPFVKMLWLSAARVNDIACARWREIDLDGSLVTVPPERMKMNSAHLIPLSSLADEVLRSLPVFKRKGDAKANFVFTTTSGARPISGFSKTKARLDALIAELQEGGDDPLPRWTFHDIRRTVRTRLSELGVADVVSELILAHARPGLHKVYDQHAYIAERRAALERWARRLQSIVEPPPKGNVVEFDAMASASRA
jgi:integrase